MCASKTPRHARRDRSLPLSDIPLPPTPRKLQRPQTRQACSPTTVARSPPPIFDSCQHFLTASRYAPPRPAPNHERACELGLVASLRPRLPPNRSLPRSAAHGNGPDRSNRQWAGRPHPQSVFRTRAQGVRGRRRPHSNVPNRRVQVVRQSSRQCPPPFVADDGPLASRVVAAGHAPRALAHGPRRRACTQRTDVVRRRGETKPSLGRWWPRRGELFLKLPLAPSSASRARRPPSFPSSPPPPPVPLPAPALFSAASSWRARKRCRCQRVAGCAGMSAMSSGRGVRGACVVALPPGPQVRPPRAVRCWRAARALFDASSVAAFVHRRPLSPPSRSRSTPTSDSSLADLWFLLRSSSSTPPQSDRCARATRPPAQARGRGRKS